MLFPFPAHQKQLGIPSITECIDNSAYYDITLKEIGLIWICETE